MFTPIISADSVAPMGPYSPGMDAGDIVFFSGQIALAPDGMFKSESILTELDQIFLNIEGLLHASKLEKTNIVKTTVFLMDLDDFGVMNKRYAEFFGDHKPARSTIQVAKLPAGARVEIEIIAKR
ncbi:MAG: Rid family detoxifying hydrolase [Candidatus Peregrinibacteria bacterium]